MGIYADQVLPRVVDWFMDKPALARLRVKTAAPLSGEVLEIGFGSGLSLPHYPDTVTRVHAVDPATLGRRLAAERIEESQIPVDFTGLDGQRIPLADASIDSALCTWTLCTIPDADQALREVQRVLRPGGVLRFVEHGRHHDPGLARWQDRLNPLQNLFAGGCNINRPIDALITQSGFDLTDLETFSMPGPRLLTWMYLGTAAKPA